MDQIAEECQDKLVEYRAKAYSQFYTLTHHDFEITATFLIKRINTSSIEAEVITLLRFIQAFMRNDMSISSTQAGFADWDSEILYWQENIKNLFFLMVQSGQ